MSATLSQLLVRLQPHIVWSGKPPDGGALTSGVHDRGYSEFCAMHHGLIAFDGGLRIFGIISGELPGCSEWNNPEGWRAEYHGLDSGLQFFAEDAFGNQFGFRSNGSVNRFLAETGGQEEIADSFIDWLGRVLTDPDEELSLWLLKAWITAGGGLAHNEHLCPKIPFVAQGPFGAENLYRSDRYESMRFKASFANQVRDLPSGAQIRLKVK
jgi:hypothetical protein